MKSQLQLQSLTVSILLTIGCGASAFAERAESPQQTLREREIAAVRLLDRSTTQKISQSSTPTPSGYKEGTATEADIKRINGSDCLSIETDRDKKKSNGACHHVVITGNANDSTLNFHFDVRDESSGVSYIVENKLRQDEKGRSFYVITDTFRHENGKSFNIVKAEGICSTDMKIPSIVVGCIADRQDGTNVRSVLNK